MKFPKWMWQLTVVDVLVGLAVLMILSALLVPIFIPPESKAVSKTATPGASAHLTQR